MWGNTLFFLVIWIFAGLLFAFYFSSFMRFLKGKIQLQLTKKMYHYGDKLEWTFTLKAKQDIQWKDVKVYLKAYKKQSRYGPKWEKNTRQIELLNISQDVESWVLYKAGNKYDYDINLVIPEIKQIFPDGIDTVEWKRSKALSRHTPVRSKRGKYTWEVRVKLESESVKLTSSRYIFVS